MREDSYFMEQALALARRGQGRASPNPLVGCVVVKNRRVVGEGWHKFFGAPHAEVIALRQAGQLARNAALYINLEPCAHWGKTPPCAPLVARSGIKRVVVSMRDPNPRVSGRGLRLLQKARIKIQAGILENQARFINRAFIKRYSTGLPYVILKVAQTLDGKTASWTKASKWITSPQARQWGHRLRAESDAIMVGGETVRQDNPTLTSHGKGGNPVRLVVSNSLNISTRSNILNSKAPTWIITGNRASFRQKQLEKQGAEILRFSIKNKVIDLREPIKFLSKVGINQILLEGGSFLSYSMIAHGLVDEAYFFVSPSLLGGKKAPTSVGGKGWTHPAQSPRLHHTTVRPIGPDFLIHGFFSN